MRQKEVFNKIGLILKELNDQYKYLEANPDDMNSLELELFVANAHFLADHAEIVNKINLQLSTQKAALPAPKEEPKSEEKYFEPVVRQPAKSRGETNDTSEEPPVINFEISPAADEEEPEIIRHELDVEEIPDWDEEEAEVEDEPIVETVIDEEMLTVPEENLAEYEEEEMLTAPGDMPTKEDLAADRPQHTLKEFTEKSEKAEQAKDEVLTINQRMSAQLKKGGVADEPVGQPISDLKHAISLNDKLLYIKDLFNGYSLAYSEAIEILNRLTSFEDAERFLTKNYVTKNNWENKADTVAKFYAVLKRRYA
nr:hypothetical protein [uncultured Mucilaginibacter sp.]